MDPLNILLWLLVIIIGIPVALVLFSVVGSFVMALIYLIREAWRNTK